MTFDPNTIPTPSAKIKVIGVGGGGTNAVSTMVKEKIAGVEFIAANTDIQSLKASLAPTKIQIGKELTKGLGAGANPSIGRDAALEDRFEIQEAIGDADMVFITAGMGGGTGTGSAAIISQIAREMGALTVGVVTKPFHFEGQRRRRHAQMGIDSLKEHVDTLITIPNQKLLDIASPNLSMVAAFQMADTVLVNAVKGISDIINIPGTINVDFADVKTIMSNMGQALMGIGRASGEGRAVEAAKQAISSPLLEDVDIEGATGILINITASQNISLIEVNEACMTVQEAAHEDANVIFGVVIDETLGDEIKVTVIATGFPTEEKDDFVQKEEAKSRILSEISNYNLDSPIIPHRKRSTPPQQSLLAQRPLTTKPAAPAKEQPLVSPKPFETKAPEEVTPPSVSSPKESHDFLIPNYNIYNSAALEQNAAQETRNIEIKQEETLPLHSDEPKFDIRPDEKTPHTFNDFSLADDIDKKIDEALQLAQRIKEIPVHEDDLDIPTFLRQNLDNQIGKP